VFLLFINATFCATLLCTCMCSAFWLVWLSCQYLSSDWLERTPNRGKQIIPTKFRPKSANDFFGLVYCFVVLLCVCLCPSPPYAIYFMVLWHDIGSLCWKCCQKHQPTNRHYYLLFDFCVRDSQKTGSNDLWIEAKQPTHLNVMIAMYLWSVRMGGRFTI